MAWTPAANLHVTLKFLGEVGEAAVAGLSSALQPIGRTQAPFELDVAGSGAFPDWRNPRVIWAGVGAGTDTVCALQAAIESALIPLGFRREGRPFHPHVTLGRVRSARALTALKRRTRPEEETRFGRSTVFEFVVMRSQLRREGASHHPLEWIPLKG